MTIDISSQDKISRRWIKRLHLSCFRSYENLSLDLDARPVILTGINGAGKTNILEAVSFLSIGKGLRKAKLDSVKNLAFPHRPWGVSSLLSMETDQGYDDIHIGTGVTDIHPEEKRVLKINQTFQPLSTLADWITVLWQTPQMDFLFSESPSKRRKFFDKLVAAFVPAYAQHLYRYEHAVKERALLLKENSAQEKWLSLLEEKISQESLAIVSLRQLYQEQLAPFCQYRTSAFPRVSVSLEGTLERWAASMPSLSVEERLQQYLRGKRKEDALKGWPEIGPHHTYIQLHHIQQNKPIEICSTGEQKALILALVLANCHLQAVLKQRTPLILLDEVVSHLDSKRRVALFEEILSLNVQAWLAGTDMSVFEYFEEKAQYFEVKEGRVFRK